MSRGGNYPQDRPPGAARESILDIQETDTYTPPNLYSTDLLAGVVQQPKSKGRRVSGHALIQIVLSGDFHPGIDFISILKRERSFQEQCSKPRRGFQGIGSRRVCGGSQVVSGF